MIYADLKRLNFPPLSCIIKHLSSWIGFIVMAVAPMVAGATEPGDEIVRIDRRPFKLCTSLDQIRNGEEFVIAYPSEADGAINMFYMSQTFNHKAGSFTCNEAKCCVTNDTTQIPFLDDAEVFTLVEPKTRGLFSIKFVRSSSDGQDMYLSNVLASGGYQNYYLGFKNAQHSSYDAAISIEAETAYASIVFNNPNYSLIVYMSNWNTNVFTCDREDKSKRNSKGRLPHIYYREKLGEESPFVRTDDVEQGQEWTASDDQRQSVHIEFQKPEGVDDSDITWRWTWFDGGTLHSTEPATGPEITLTPPVAAVYTLSLSDGTKTYETAVSVYPSGDAHFRGDWFVAQCNFPYFIRGYREGYEYSYMFVPSSALYAPGDKGLRGAPRKATIMNGDTEYDHSTGVPDPGSAPGEFYFGIRRNGLSTVHSLGYSETSGTEVPVVDEKPAGPLYDLLGRKLPERPAFGLYILDGRVHFAPGSASRQ